MEDVRKEIETLKKRVAKLEASQRDPEGELQPWVKRQLAKARTIPDSACVNFNDLVADLRKKPRTIPKKQA
jgi:hypothetical protein